MAAIQLQFAVVGGDVRLLLRNQAAEFLGANTNSFHPAQMDLDITNDTTKIRESVMAMDRASLVAFLGTVGFRGFRPEIS